MHRTSCIVIYLLFQVIRLSPTYAKRHNLSRQNKLRAVPPVRVKTWDPCDVPYPGKPDFENQCQLQITEYPGLCLLDNVISQTMSMQIKEKIRAMNFSTCYCRTQPHKDRYTYGCGQSKRIGNKFMHQFCQGPISHLLNKLREDMTEEIPIFEDLTDGALVLSDLTYLILSAMRQNWRLDSALSPYDHISLNSRKVNERSWWLVTYILITKHILQREDTRNDSPTWLKIYLPYYISRVYCKFKKWLNAPNIKRIYLQLSGQYSAYIPPVGEFSPAMLENVLSE